jgi:hypothetical protein
VPPATIHDDHALRLPLFQHKLIFYSLGARPSNRRGLDKKPQKYPIAY